MIHDFLDGSAFVMKEPMAATEGVLTPICRPVEPHVDGYARFVDNIGTIAKARVFGVA
jgi:hypothetical protein